MRLILLLIGLFTLATGPIAFFAPKTFYETIPGLEMMGPFNLHFIRDVGLAFTASGAAMIWGGWHRNRAVAIAGASWLTLHGLFHIYIQFNRGLPGDLPMWFDLIAVMTPALLGMIAAFNLKEMADE